MSVELANPAGVLKPPPLVELIPQGTARRLGVTDAERLACDSCGRHRFPRPKNLSVDIGTWDGADFLTVDDNPNILIVTQTVKAWLAHEALSNIDVEAL